MTLIIFIANTKAQIMALQFDEESNYLAAGMRHGSIHIYNLKYNELETRIDQVDETEYALVDHGPQEVQYPITCLKWQPRYGGLRGRNILAASYGNNMIKIWDTTKKSPLHTIVEPENKGIYSIDYNASGSLLLTGGADATLRVYDDKTKKIVYQFKPGLNDVVHHFNRIH